MYRLDWLVEQHEFNTAGIDAMEDQDLAALLKDMERARECIQEGISLDDAGLVASVVPRLPNSD